MASTMLFDLIRDFRNGFPHRAPDMIRDRYSANLGQATVDLQVTAIGREERQPDRSSVVNELQLRQPLIQMHGLGWC